MILSLSSAVAEALSDEVIAEFSDYVTVTRMDILAALSPVLQAWEQRLEQAEAQLRAAHIEIRRLHKPAPGSWCICHVCAPSKEPT